MLMRTEMSRCFFYIFYLIWLTYLIGLWLLHTYRYSYMSDFLISNYLEVEWRGLLSFNQPMLLSTTTSNKKNDSRKVTFASKRERERRRKRTHVQVMFAVSFCSLPRLLSLGVSQFFLLFLQDLLCKVRLWKKNTRERSNSVQNVAKEANYFQLM